VTLPPKSYGNKKTRLNNNNNNKKPSCHCDSRPYFLATDYLVISDCC